MVALRQIGENIDIQQDAPYDVVASFAIRCTAERAYRMWRDFENLPMKPLLGRIKRGEINPAFVTSHRLPITQAPEAYRMFREKQDHCTKVVLDPWSTERAAA